MAEEMGPIALEPQNRPKKKRVSRLARQQAKAERWEGYLKGTHTRRGKVRKNVSSNNCAEIAALYGHEIHTSKKGKSYYLKKSKSGKIYKRYCRS